MAFEVGADIAGAGAAGGIDLYDDELGARPTLRLPFLQLAQISLYWLGINAIMGGIGIAIPERLTVMFPGDKGTFIAIQGFIVLWVNILVQPTVGMISDYTQTRWRCRACDLEHLPRHDHLPRPA